MEDPQNMIKSTARHFKSTSIKVLRRMYLVKNREIMIIEAGL